MKIKGVLFDLDDTLYDFSTLEKLALKRTHQYLIDNFQNISFEAFSRMFLKVRDEVQENLKNTGSSHNRIIYFQRIVEELKGKSDPNISIELYEVYWSTIFENMRLYDAAYHLLFELKKRKLKIGIISDHVTYIQLRKIKALELNQFVDIIVTSEEAGEDKPGKKMFTIALKKIGLNSDEVVLVGDNPKRDISGAKRAGIKSVLFNTQGKTFPIDHQYEESPDFIISDLMELLNFL